MLLFFRKPLPSIIFDVPKIALFIVGLIAVLLLASVKPISSLKKMNTAAELKYE